MDEEVQIAVLGFDKEEYEHYIIKKNGHFYYVIYNLHGIFTVTETEFEEMDTENLLPIDLKIIEAVDKYIMDTVSNGKSAEVDRPEAL